MQSPAAIKRACDLLRKGVGIHKVTRETGVSRHAAEKLRDQIRKETGQFQHLENLKQDDKARLDEQISAKYEALIRDVSKLHRPRSVIDWKPPVAGPVAIAFLADIHAGRHRHRTTNRSTATWI
jgi:hypothetical protein